MSLIFAPLFSGSSGNCVFVSDGRGKILVDAGVSGAKVEKALKQIGVHPSDLNAILVTHEHSDHISGVGILSRKYDLPIYATAGTWQAMRDKLGAIAAKNVCEIEAFRNFYLCDMDVLPFSIPHDAADPVGFSFESRGSRFSVATDLGCIRESWLKYVLGADAVLLEANYDPDMLQAGRYPYDLKKRILSRKGHLSNDNAGDAAGQLVDSGTKQIILGHLSKENNFPELARKSVENILYANGIDPDRDLSLDVAKRDEVTGLYEISAGITVR